MEKIKRPRGLFFTESKPSVRAVFGFFLGLLALVCVFVAVYLTFRNQETAKVNYGAALVLCFFFGLAGLVLSLLSLKETEIQKRWSYAAIGVNSLVLLLVGGILYMGLQVF